MREGFHLGGGCGAGERLGEDRGNAEGFLGETLDDGFGGGLIRDEDSLEVGAEHGFDGACAWVIHLDHRGEHAADAAAELLGCAEAVEHVARAFLESFAGRDELAHGVEAGGAAGEVLVGVGGRGACGIEVATGVVVGAFRRLEGFFEFAELGAGLFDFGCDAGLFGADGPEFEDEALFFFGELSGAFAVAYELGEGGFDFHLSRGDHRLGAVRFAACFAEGGFDALASFAAGVHAAFGFSDEDLLLGDAAI